VKNRLITAVMVGGLLLASAACDKSDDTTTAAATSAAAPSAAATSAAAATGTAPKEQCDMAKATVTTAITKLLSTAAAAAQTGGNDPKAVEATIQKSAAEFVTQLQAASAGITDPALKTALTDWTAAVSAKASKVKTIQDVNDLQKLDTDPSVARANSEMARLCGE
jgi:hypothetical protein